jgi:hypothetical protein
LDKLAAFEDDDDDDEEEEEEAMSSAAHLSRAANAGGTRAPADEASVTGLRNLSMDRYTSLLPR